MSAPMTPAQWKKQLKKFGVKTVYLEGWETRGRPPIHGPFSDVHGIVIHHTGGQVKTGDAYSKFLFITGRSDLPAPLCHAEGRWNGTIVMGAARRANHAGPGNPNTLAQVKAETTPYDHEIRPNSSNDVDGNRNFYGIEIDYGASYDGPTPAQYDAAVAWAAAICDFHGWTGASCIGHREWTYIKTDPARIRMYQFRQDVNALIEKVNNGNSTPIPPPEPPVTTVYPADILPLANSKYQGCVGPSEHPIDIKQPMLAKFTNKNFYVVNGNQVIFDCPVEGTTTSGSDFTRSEIKVEESFNTRQTRRLNVSYKIHRLPDDNEKCCIAQFHDGFDDVAMVMIEGTELSLHISKGKGLGSTKYVIDPNLQKGTQFFITLRCKDNVISVDYKRLGSTAILTIQKPLKKTHYACYRKYGAYNQTDQGTGGSKIGVYSVSFN